MRTPTIHSSLILPDEVSKLEDDFLLSKREMKELYCAADRPSMSTEEEDVVVTSAGVMEHLPPSREVVASCADAATAQPEVAGVTPSTPSPAFPRPLYAGSSYTSATCSASVTT